MRAEPLRTARMLLARHNIDGHCLFARLKFASIPPIPVCGALRLRPALTHTRAVPPACADARPIARGSNGDSSTGAQGIFEASVAEAEVFAVDERLYTPCYLLVPYRLKVIEKYKKNAEEAHRISQ